MKNVFNRMSFKMLLPAMAGALLLSLASCGSGEKKEGESTDAPKSMIEEPKADDGQGVGKFKDVTLAALDAKVAETGKSVFEAKCSACHNATDVKKVGPGLKGVTTRRQPAWILNMITNPQEMTQKDPTAKKLLEEHLTQMTFQDVSDEQAKQILEYFRQNDAGGETAAKK
ncbi:MAG: cytochrome c [Chitinophagales bacterium]